MDWKISGIKGGLKGEIMVPPDKSVSHRAIMFGAISKGRMRVRNFLFAEDCMRTFQAFSEMGCCLERRGDDVVVTGKGLKGLEEPRGDLYLGNSGTTMRIISGIIAGCGLQALLTGDESLSKRPMGRIIVPLRKMGALIRSGEGDKPPIRIEKNPRSLDPINYETPVASAQVKSCVLAAGLYASGETTVTEPFQSRDHTERMLSYFSAGIECKGKTTKITGMKELTAADVTVPGDISSAAFFMVAASIVEKSDVLFRGVGLNPTRRGILDVLKRMGASIEITDRR
jgi:3-phosphoshikimate 1-carboxyvinyltransferase